MSGRVCKRLRRLARLVSKNENATVIAVNQVTKKIKTVNLYEKYKRAWAKKTRQEKKDHAEIK